MVMKRALLFHKCQSLVFMHCWCNRVLLLAQRMCTFTFLKCITSEVKYFCKVMAFKLEASLNSTKHFHFAANNWINTYENHKFSLQNTNYLSHVFGPVHFGLCIIFTTCHGSSCMNLSHSIYWKPIPFTCFMLYIQ